jgi:hypothetical protein
VSTKARRRRAVLIAQWVSAGLLLGMVTAFAFLMLLSQTPWGHGRVLKLTLGALGKQVRGALHVQRIDGNLLTGARLYGVRLVGQDGEPFVVADSADLDYDLRTLLTPRIVFNKVVLYQPQVFVRRMPGDSLWNYEELFRDTTPSTGPRGPDRATNLDSVRLVNARVRVEMPWEPTPGLSARARRREVAEALSDTSPTLVRRVAGGYVRTMNFTGLTGRLSGIRFAPGTEGGSFFRIDSLGGRAQVFRDPVRIVQVRGRLALLPGHIEFDTDTIRLPASRLAAGGVVRFEEGVPDPLYDILLVGDSIAFRDLQWLYPRFPREATGGGTLRIESRPEGVMYLVRQARMAARGTRVAGSFGMILGDTIRFVEVDLRADPLRVATLEAMLPQKLPVVGLHVGNAEIKGSNAPGR